MYTWLINHLNLPEYYHHSRKAALPFLATSPYRHEKSDTWWCAYLHSSDIKHLIRTALMFSVDALVSPIVHVKTCEEFYSFVRIKLVRDFSMNEFICFFNSLACVLFFPWISVRCWCLINVFLPLQDEFVSLPPVVPLGPVALLGLVNHLFHEDNCNLL